jgi:SRSO17 transposase
MSEIIETVPELKLTPQDINKLGPELEAYQAIYSPLFQRREQREQAQKYLHGLLLDDVPNKSIETMLLALVGDDPNAIRAMQQFVGQGAWADTAILGQHWREVDQDLGDEQGVLILDGSDFAKQGADSVGVKRQWCGELGKTANCQAGVFLAYASHKGYTLLDRRLYLPEEWLTDPTYAQRRQKCGLPTEIEFQTKPELGQEMIRAVHMAGTLRYHWLTCDESFGQNPAFLDSVAKLVWYYAEVPHDTRVWLERPTTGIPEWSGRGRQSVRERVLPAEPTAQTVKAIAAALPPEQWSRHIIKEGGKGPMVADFAALRVVAVREGLPGPEVWLVLRRDLSSGELKCYLSNAPVDTSLTTLVWLSGMRWPTETCFREGKQLVGLGDYQLRSWIGWHHHMTLCILAHFFLVRLKLRLKAEAPALTLPQAFFNQCDHPQAGIQSPMAA